MATSVQLSIIGSMPRGIPKSQAVGHSSNLLRSQFLGSGRLHVPSGLTLKQRSEPLQAAKVGRVNAFRSASFFDNLGRLFSSSTAGTGTRKAESQIGDEEHVFAVYEINEKDRKSPVPLLLSPHITSKRPCLGDLVPYTNKVYGPSGKDYLGISAGLCVAIEHGTPKGDRYETTYTHYIGQYGQLSAMGPYYSTGDSEMVVTGGTGIFKGARGIVTIRNVVSPIKLLYTYYITGIQKPPSELTKAVVPLPEEAKKSTAKASA